MFGLDEETTKTIIVFASAVLFFAYLVHYIIEGLKKADKLPGGNAGKANELISALIGFAIFALRLFGAPESEGVEIEQTAVMLAESILFIIATVGAANLYHQFVKLIRGLFVKEDAPKVVDLLAAGPLG